MNQVTVKISGMSCGMCESHINEVIRRTVPGAKKVTSSHRTGVATFLSEEEPDQERLRSAIEATGYGVLSIESGPYEKKGFFHR